MNERLPIKQIFYDGMKIPFRRRHELLRLGWPYALLILAYSFVPEETGSLPLDIVSGILFCITGILGVVRCHRVFLLTPEATTDTHSTHWGQRETKYLLSSILIGILTIIVAIPAFILIFYLEKLTFIASMDHSTTSQIIVSIAFIPISYFTSRWSLVLPGLAVDNDRSLSWAWNISSNHAFKLFILLGALPIMTNIILQLLVAPLPSSYFLNFIENAAWLVTGVIEVCLLSLSYGWVVGHQPPASSTDPDHLHA